MSMCRRVKRGSYCGVLLAMVLITQAGAVPEQIRLMKEMEGAQKKEGPGTVQVPQVNYKAVGLREPFTPAYQTSGGGSPETPGAVAPQVVIVVPPSLTVSGLMWGGSVPQAIVNGKVVRVGDTVLGATITQIDQTGVEITFQGKTFNVRSPAAGAAKTQTQTSQGGSL